VLGKSFSKNPVQLSTSRRSIDVIPHSFARVGPSDLNTRDQLPSRSTLYKNVPALDNLVMSGLVLRGGKSFVGFRRELYFRVV
jgi:hypothetical protein